MTILLASTELGPVNSIPVVRFSPCQPVGSPGGRPSTALAILHSRVIGQATLLGATRWLRCDFGAAPPRKLNKFLRTVTGNAVFISPTLMQYLHLGFISSLTYMKNIEKECVLRRSARILPNQEGFKRKSHPSAVLDVGSR
jgi:hypothetical protein